jgi:hypothetical protein
MARGPAIPEADVKRARKVLELERKNAPYRKPDAFGAYVMLFIALAIAGAIVYYIFVNKEQVSRLWYRATHPDSVPVQTQPDQ